jgi:Protein of unknown function (DUF3341)
MALPNPFRRKPAAQMPGVLASFEHVDAATDAIRWLRKNGHKRLTVYASHPNHEIEEALETRVSPVRLFTLIGGITGLTAATCMQIWMNRDWPVLVGGKPIVAMPAFVVIMFELTVLTGALLTLGATGGLSALLEPNRAALYDDRFTDDRIGVFVPADRTKVRELEALMLEFGAVEVRHAA